jgi:hypothetical protein
MPRDNPLSEKQYLLCGTYVAYLSSIYKNINQSSGSAMKSTCSLIAAFLVLWGWSMHAHSAAILNIWDDGTSVHYEFNGGTLDFAGMTTATTITNHGIWRSPNISSLHQYQGAIATSQSAGWTSAGTYTNDSTGALLDGSGYLVMNTSNLYLFIDSGAVIPDSTTVLDAHFTVDGTLASFGYTPNESFVYILPSSDTFTIITSTSSEMVSVPASVTLLTLGMAGIGYSKRKNFSDKRKKLSI